MHDPKRGERRRVKTGKVDVKRIALVGKQVGGGAYTIPAVIKGLNERKLKKWR